MDNYKEGTRFNELTGIDIQHIIELYNNINIPKKIAQEKLSIEFNVTERTIRDWANKLDLNTMKNNEPLDEKILVYDIETSRAVTTVWWTGKQYVGHKQIIEDPKIITIAWKWLGSDVMHYKTWDDNHCDKELLTAFLKDYNKADMVIGQNNDRFDNRWVNARAVKHDLDVNVHIKSFDIMKQTKRLLRLPSYSMAYITKYLGITEKQNHEGIIMWDMIERGTPEEQEEYLGKMLEYNIGDIISTEEMYLKLRKYMGNVMHFGVLKGESKYSCPNCGGTDIELYKTMTTASGTIQRVIKCNHDKVQFKVSNTLYLKNNI